MNFYINYQEIKDKHEGKAPDLVALIFHFYVMDVITKEERREARKIWRKKETKVLWEDFLISYVNFIKVGLDPKEEIN